MTRVNVGLHPSELCDQHLLAEYRELPRCFGKATKQAAPPRFTLGKGHVAWCCRYQGSLSVRQAALVAELLYRGFEPTHTSVPSALRDGRYWQPADHAHARPIVIARIQERLRTMVRAPRWTARARPQWALEALASRALL